MRRLWVVVPALLPVAAWAQPPIWWNGGGGGSGTVAPSSFSSPTGTLTVGGTTDAVTLDADTTIVPLYSTGTDDPATCTAGGMFHLRTDSTLLKICAATDTWLQLYTITDDSVLVGTGTTTASKAIADCDDTGGNHLNYDTTTNAFSCGTSSGGSGVGAFFVRNNQSSGIGASTTTYMPLNSSAAPTTEVASYWLTPTACTAKDLYVITSAAQSATGALVVTLRKNGAGTTITTTIAAGAGAGTFSDTTHTVSYAAGDQMALEFANAATATSANIRGVAVRCY